MNRSLLLFVVAASALVMGESETHAFPIPPVTLWSLVERADQVVVARVSVLERGLARLSVKETWKGPKRRSIRVSYFANMICPSPARYDDGETVVAFLERSHDDAWRTVGLSYGTLYPSSKEIPVFRERVRTALALQSTGEVRPEQRVVWLVETAARAATRWHGVYELRPHEDRLHKALYDRAERPDAGVDLTPAELERLARGLVDEPRLDFTFPMMLTLLRGHENETVDGVAVALMDRLVNARLVNTSGLPFWTEQAIDLVVERFEYVTVDAADSPPHEPLRRVPEKTDEDLRAMWLAVRARLPVDTNEQPPLPRREIRGVGEDTAP